MLRKSYGRVWGSGLSTMSSNNPEVTAAVTGSTPKSKQSCLQIDSAGRSREAFQYSSVEKHSAETAC